MAGKPGAERVAGQAREQLTQELAEAYGQGASIRDLAASSGRSYGLIHKLLGEAGVQLRGRGGATRGRARDSVE